MVRIISSNIPPHNGALNDQVVLILAKYHLTLGLSRVAAIAFATALKVLALSDGIRTEKLLDVKRFKLRINACEVISGTMSKCTAHKQIHTFLEETTVSLT